MDPEKKRKFNKNLIEKSFPQKIRRKPITIISNNESQFLIEISNEKESRTLPNLKALCDSQYNERVKHVIFACDKINESKSLI